MWKPLQMMSPPDGYRVAAFTPTYNPETGEHGIAADTSPVLAVVLAEWEPGPGSYPNPTIHNRGDRCLTLAYLPPGDYSGTVLPDTRLLAEDTDNADAVQVLPPGSEPDLDVGRAELKMATLVRETRWHRNGTDHSPGSCSVCQQQAGAPVARA